MSLAILRASGYASGYVNSTSNRVRVPHATPMRISMTPWGYSGCRCVRMIFRGRRHDTLSERRMREIRTSGATSGDWKRGYGLD